MSHNTALIIRLCDVRFGSLAAPRHDISPTATRSATVLQLKGSWVQLNLALATSPELPNAFDIVEAQGISFDL